MRKLHELSNRERRCNERLLRRVMSARGGIFVRGEDSFRIAERLHKAGLISAQPSKWGWGGGRRPFRELFLSVVGSEDSSLPRMPR